MNSYELEQALACKQMELEDLRQQLEQAHADIAGLHDQLEEPQITQDEYKLELEQLRQRLTKINDTIYLIGAPIGSKAYFTIRKLCCDNAEKKEQLG